ncbi:MAG: sulfotransferase [Flavobacteriales bacterium]|nr:sulfotransferase [Flavobacteriales bacterium]MBK9174809.1 sulfotransferase [Flavobacteriales bacterium]
MGQRRTTEHARNAGLEQLLAELNAVLGGAESGMHELPAEPAHPIILVVAAPRSGTTLFMQWLAGTGQVCYPSNLLSRFYAAPYLGARIQQLIADPRFNFKDELADASSYTIPFTSLLGKTKGLLQPNEFWYFWRRFIPNMEPEWITPEQEALIDTVGFRRGIAHIQCAFDKPFAAKGLILQYNLTALHRMLGKVLFVHIAREPWRAAHSLLRARMTYYGDEGAWYSAKPPEYEVLKECEPAEQVAGQVICTQAAIERQFAELPDACHLTVGFDAFRNDPAALYRRIGERIVGLGGSWDPLYTGPHEFELREVPLEPSLEERLRRACARFQGIVPQLS